MEIRPIERHRFVILKQELDDLDPFFEANETLIQLEQIESKVPVFSLLPSGAESHVKTATRQIVDRRRTPGGNDRIAE